MRRRHPFEGRRLSVVSSINRGGVLQLLVMLPFGDRALIPVDWTDMTVASHSELAHSSVPQQDPCSLAGLTDLLRLRQIIDALQNRPFESAKALEGSHAAQTHSHRPERSTLAISTVATDERRDTDRGARNSRTSHRPQTRKRTGKGGRR